MPESWCFHKKYSFWNILFWSHETLRFFSSHSFSSSLACADPSRLTFHLNFFSGLKTKKVTSMNFLLPLSGMQVRWLGAKSPTNQAVGPVISECIVLTYPLFLPRASWQLRRGNLKKRVQEILPSLIWSEPVLNHSVHLIQIKPSLASQFPDRTKHESTILHKDGQTKRNSKIAKKK